MVHLGPRTGVEFGAIRQELREVRVRLGAIANSVQQSHSDWVLGSDARLTCFAKLANVVESTELALKFLDESLSHVDWWNTNYNPRPSSRDAALYIVEFSQFAKAGLLQLGFGAVESSFRVFLRAIDPLACGGGTREFKSVYECLLRTKLQLTEADDRIGLLDLLRELRNTIHNHGVYFHRRHPDAVISYGGVSYDFTTGTRVEFATWPLLISLFSAVAELLGQVVAAGPISGLMQPIVDPASWPAAGSVDTRLSYMFLLLKVHRAQIAQR